MARSAGLAAALSAAPVQSQPASTPPAVRDGSHDMDFSFGRWRTDITIYNDPFNNPNSTTHMSGTKTASAVWGGKAVLEEIEADGPGAEHWEAANLMLYDPVSGQWTQNYVDNTDGRFEAAPGVGEYRNGTLEFIWQTKVNGRTVLVRGIWSSFSPNSHTYEVSRSNDGGRTWHPSFVAHMTRIKRP
jgi:hypothetical protein